VKNQFLLHGSGLDHGANANVVDKDGNSPLWHAILNRNVDLVELLVQHGANVNALDRQGQPPLARVNSPSSEEDRQIRDLLIKAGADPEFARRRGIWLADDAGPT
jgi:ankyrin repeat protein